MSRPKLSDVHLLHIIDFGYHPARAVTVCGLVGWQEKCPSNEFATASGDRFEAHAERNAYVDCPKCLK